MPKDKISYYLLVYTMYEASQYPLSLLSGLCLLALATSHMDICQE